MYSIFYAMILLYCLKICYQNKIKIGYNLIYLFSFIQLKIQKYSNTKIKTIQTLDSLEILNIGEDCHLFECINNDELIEFNELKQNIPDNVFKNNQHCSIIVYNIPNTINMVCFYPPLLCLNLNYELSKVWFISFKIIYHNEEYSIQLTTPEYNFYIVNNKINSSWVKYYFTKYTKTNFNEGDPYLINIIDEHVQFISLNENNSIIFTVDSYTIL